MKDNKKVVVLVTEENLENLEAVEEKLQELEVEESEESEELEELEESEVVEIVDAYTTQLNKLKETFAGLVVRKNITSAVYMSVDSLTPYPRVKEVLTKVSNYLEIPTSAPFLKFKCTKEGFKGIAYPAIGSHNGKVAANVNNQVFYLDKAWSKKLLRFKAENNAFYMSIHDADMGVTDIVFPIYVHDAKLINQRLTSLVNFKFASENLVPLTFDSSTFEDGEYEVKSFSKKETRCTCNIIYKKEITNIFISEYSFKNLQSARDAEQPLVYVIDGYRKTKTGNYRNTYIKGFLPLNFTKLAELVQVDMEKMGITSTIEEYFFAPSPVTEKVEGTETSPEVIVGDEKAAKTKTQTVEKVANDLKISRTKEVFPLTYTLKGLQQVEVNKNNPVGVMLILEVDGILRHVGLNAGMRRDYRNGLLNLKSFEGTELILTDIGKYQEYLTFSYTWNIPNESFDNDAIDELSSVLFPDAPLF